jgi:hypothetical protein
MGPNFGFVCNFFIIIFTEISMMAKNIKKPGDQKSEVRLIRQTNRCLEMSPNNAMTTLPPITTDDSFEWLTRI